MREVAETRPNFLRTLLQSVRIGGVGRR